MVSRRFVSIVFGFALASGWIAPQAGAATGCVWKVTAPNGSVLYLAGSWHALRKSDYPLPACYDRAFDASNRLAYEIKPRELDKSSSVLDRVGSYPKGDNLKNHVDPRTYAYLKRFFGLLGVSEATFSRYRPWYLSMALESPNSHGLAFELGVERFFHRRAEATSKPIEGLESGSEHAAVFSGLSEKGSEALLLITFIPAEKGTPTFNQMMSAWRRGDAEYLASATRREFGDFPAMATRLLDERNHRWIPKIEGYLASGKTYFVVVGAAHMGGSNGVLALLRGKGYKVEQL
jgi:uncharacterized protein